jgi:ribosomal protein L11 methylase PrmA
MIQPLNSSFRDPNGFIFKHECTFYRQVNQCCSDIFDRFNDSGLYEALVNKGYLIPHVDVTESEIPRSPLCYRLLKPTQLPYISYPYEWCFSQFQDAAMLTLRIQTVALKFGFVLKDASAYNVQFVSGKPIFIDTLSFEPYQEGQAWTAYRQFCQHFLAPLALMSCVDVALGKMMMTYIDGIPLDLASKLLPIKSRLSIGLQTHIHLHAKMQASYSNTAERNSGEIQNSKKDLKKIAKSGLQGIVESLAVTVRRLRGSTSATEWGNYYEQTNYDEQATAAKRILVADFLDTPDEPLSIIQDLGSNTGEFSRIAAPFSNLVVSQDIDPLAVEKNYLSLRAEAKETNVLPLIQDFSAPSPAIGWANRERNSFMQRAQCDLVMALALIHHLAITNNLPLEVIGRSFAQLGQWLIIEFVPKTDSQVRRMLATRNDTFPDYHQFGFELAFERNFEVRRREMIKGGHRTLYLMRRKSSREIFL